MRWLIVFAILLLPACGGSLSSRLVDAHKIIDIITDATLEAFHAECLARARRCKEQGIKKALDCTAWRECDNARAGMINAVKLIENGLLATDQAYRTAKQAGVLK